MGLQNQLTDISTDSLPIFLLASIANTLCYLRSLIFTFFNISISNPQSDANHFHTIGSGLAGLLLLAEQLNLNRVFSYKYSLCSSERSDCVVCLNDFADGEQVRKLKCQHVFHKDCFDGWLDCFNFKCPLCRTPLVSDERVAMTRRRMTGDVMDWFALR